MMIEKLSVLNALLLMIHCVLTDAQENIFTFSSNQPYFIGEEVVLTCYVYPTARDYSNFALISFNGSTPESVGTINANTPSTGYTATGAILEMGNSARIELTITSFQVSDNNTLFGCHAEFSDNGTFTEVLESGYPPIADPVTGLEGTHTITILSGCNIQTFFNVTSIISNRLTDLNYTFQLRDSNTGSVLQTITQATDSLSPNATFSVMFEADVCYNLSVSVVNCANTGDRPSAQPVYFSLQGVRTSTGEFQTSSTNASLVEWKYKTDTSCPNNYEEEFLTKDLFWFHLIDQTNNNIFNISDFSLFLPERFDFYIPDAYDLSTNNYALRIQLCNQNLTDLDIPIRIVASQSSTVMIILIVLMVLLIILLIIIVLIITLFLVIYFYKRRDHAK